MRRVDLGVLDGLRGVAALYVAVTHATHLLWGQSGGVLVGPGLTQVLASIWLRAVDYGQEAVILFFLLSGFCIHFRLAKQGMATAGRPRLDIRDFAWRRFRRLFPVLLVALGATLALDSLGAWMYPGLYAGTAAHPRISDLLGLNDHSLLTLVGNLGFQSNLVVPTFGTNAPLWSIGFEFWFYALYPIFAFMTWHLGAARGLGATLAISVVALLIARVGLTRWDAGIPVWPLAILGHWVTWTAGAFLAEAYVGRVRVRYLPVIAVVGLTVLVALGAAHPGGAMGNPSWWDLGWTVGLGGLLAWTMLRRADDQIGRGIESIGRFGKPLGAISYSLYVLHFPWVVLVCAWWFASGHTALPLGGELIAVGLLGALTLAGLSWFMVERHFVSARTRQLNPGDRRQPAAAVDDQHDQRRQHRQTVDVHA